MSEQATADETLAPLPPLRIHHFLAWMAVAAVVLSLNKNLLRSTYLSAMDSTSLLHLLVQTVCVTCLGIGIYWRRLGIWFPSQPGHGLLMQQCLISLWTISNHLLLTSFVEYDEYNRPIGWNDLPEVVSWYFSWQANIWGVLEGFLFLSCAIWLTKVTKWRAFFAWLGISELVNVIFSIWIIQEFPNMSVQELNNFERWYVGISIGFEIVTVGFFAVVIFTEKIQSKKYHWSHWCGVVCFLVVSLTYLGSEIWEYLYPYDWYSLPPQGPAQNYNY